MFITSSTAIMYSAYFVILFFAALIGWKFIWNLLKIPVEFAQEVQNSESTIKLISELEDLRREGKLLFDGFYFDVKKIDSASYGEWRTKSRNVLTKYHLKRYLDLFDGIAESIRVESIRSQKLLNSIPTNFDFVETEDQKNRKEFWQNDVVKKLDYELIVLAEIMDCFAPFTIAIRKEN